MATEKRLIDANRTRYELNIAYCDNHGERRRGVADAIEIINMMPTVDAVEVVHGRWIKRRFTDTLTGYECSICHTTWDADTSYCSNCGAKMDGGNEDV